MINRRSYIAESAIKPGCAVVQGSADNKVKSPDNKGDGDFIGLYAFEANEVKEKNEAVGIVLHGVAKALAGAAVASGKKAVIKDDDSGSLIALPSEKGNYVTVGTFLESGIKGEYVDVLIERGNVSV